MAASLTKLCDMSGEEVEGCGLTFEVCGVGLWCSMVSLHSRRVCLQL